MAKKAKKKSGMKGIILSVLAMVFGVLLFCSMFMPMIAIKNIDDTKTKVSATNVLTAMSFDNLTEADNEEEIAAYGLIKGEDTAAKTKAAALLNLFASILGGLLVVAALLAMVFKWNILKTLTLAFGALGTLCAIGAIISIFVLLGTEIAGMKFSESAGIHAASFIAIISGITATVCAWLKK